MYIAQHDYFLLHGIVFATECCNENRTLSQHEFQLKFEFRRDRARMRSCELICNEKTNSLIQEVFDGRQIGNLIFD